MKSLYEELGGTYRQVGDYFIPDIELPERNYEIGKYGRMRHRYLKPHPARKRKAGKSGILTKFFELIWLLATLKNVDFTTFHLVFLCQHS